MRSCLFLGVPLLLAATPAFATGGFDCRTTDRSNIRMTGTIGHVIASPLVAAQLRVGPRTLSTTGARPQIAIGRSWIDSREIRVDLVDAQASRFEAQLRARMIEAQLRRRMTTRIGATGTLVRDGVTHRVQCEVE